MLLNMIIHQPQAVGSILKNTPYWVWGLLAVLVWLGSTQLRDRTVGVPRAAIMPIAMTAFSMYGVASAFGGSGHALAVAGAWLAAALAVACAGLKLWPAAPRGTSYAAGSRSFFVPGSTVPLALIVGIFLTKYLVGVELALQPGLARDPGFAVPVAALYGVFNGFFAARSLRLWRLVRRRAPQVAQGTTAPASA